MDESNCIIYKNAYALAMRMVKRFVNIAQRIYYIEPVIMRRFVVPATITLDRLHDVIQIVMGME